MPYSSLRNFARIGVLMLAMAGAMPAFAAKSDVIYLQSGDRITGEIKNLERGRLKLSTDSLGTIYIEWQDVARVTSPASFIVELANGRRARGSLVDTELDRQIVVRYRDRERVLDMAEVVWIDPLKLEGSIGDRWDGSFSVGLDIAKTNNDTSFSGNFDVRRRAEDYQLQFNGAASLRSQDGTDDRRRITLGALYRRLLEERWYRALIGSLERNDELGIDLRSLAGAGFGRFLIQTSDTLWSATGGLAVVNEQRAGDEDAETNLEAVLITDYEYFLYDTPKTTLTTSFSVFPSITDAGRVRTELDFSLRRELIKDLFLELNLYGTYDNRPPDEGEKTDYGIVTSVGYSF